jgi:hypothetical protein
MQKSLLTASLVATLATAASTHAALIVNDGFEYADQAAFQAAWPAIGTTTDTTKQSAQLSTAQANGGTKSAFIPVSTTATTTATEFRNRATFAETGTLTVGTKLTWTFDYYDSTGSGNPQRNFANLQDTTAPGSSNQLVSMGLNNNELSTDSGGNYYMARILGYSHAAVDPDGGTNEIAAGTSSGAYFKLNDFGTGLRSLGWHTLQCVMTTPDGALMDYDFFVDGVLVEKVHGVVGTLRSYDNITIGSGLTNGGVNVYFDNMSLDLGTVPEPTSLSVLALGGIAASARRRRSR